MGDKNSFEGLHALVAERGSVLLATATLLAGSRSTGEDLLQSALERLMRRWRRVTGDPEGYLRRTMYHLAVDQWRYRRRRPEVLAAVDRPDSGDPNANLDLRHALVAALATLPPRQRAVLVLRYWEQLGEVVHAGRSGGVDTYRYTYQAPATDDVPAHPVSGEVHVAADTNLIVKITQDLTVTGPNPEIADKDPITFRTVVTFSDFGTPVTVERPTT